MYLENLVVENILGKLVVTINTPEKLNCLDLKTLGELEKIIRFANNTVDIVGVIIIGQGSKSFVSGADINEFKSINVVNSREFSLYGQEVFSLIENCKKPIIAAVNGYALGGGCELAMACHIRVLSENAKVGLPEVKLGIIPGYGGTYRLPRIIGVGRALEYMLTGKLMNAQEALQFGFANHVKPFGEILEFSHSLLDSILCNSPTSIEMILNSVNSYNSNSFKEIEADNFRNCFDKSDVVEGVDAFLNKRKPNFLKNRLDI